MRLYAQREGGREVKGGWEEKRRGAVEAKKSGGGGSSDELRRCGEVCVVRLYFYPGGDTTSPMGMNGVKVVR